VLGRASDDAIVALVGDAAGHHDVASLVWAGERGMAMISGVAVDKPPPPGMYEMEATGIVVPGFGERVHGSRLARRRKSSALKPPKVGEMLGGATIEPDALSWADELGRAGDLAIRWYWNGAAALGGYATLPLQCEGATMTGEWVIEAGLWRLLRRVMGRGQLSILISMPAFTCADRVWFHAAGPRGFVYVRR
jgi:hypothetical protein